MKIFDSHILHKVLIKAPREKVFDAMTTAEGLDGWFTQGSSVDRKVGGKIIFRWVNWGPDKHNIESTAPIFEVQYPERFVFKWWDDHYTTVEMDFQETSEGTVVSVNEHSIKIQKKGIDGA